MKKIKLIENEADIIIKKQKILMSLAFMKIRQQRNRLLFIPNIFGILLLLAMLLSSVTIVFSQTDWIRYENNPILELGPSGSWDKISIEVNITSK